jgi:phosphatidylserine/phosphatidylglycerophosphate/cardiolipin synthase-like enzyme
MAVLRSAFASALLVLGGLAPHPASARPVLGGLATRPAAVRAGAEPTLVTEPAQGLAPIYALLGSARSSIHMTLYELLDPTATTLLTRAADRGVQVQVILDQNRKARANTRAYNELTAHGVAVHWADPDYACTHQKTLTVDGATSAVLTFNFTPRYYATSRDFGVITRDPADVAAIEATFQADFSDRTIVPPTGDDLVWSPTNARSSLIDLIASASSTLLVENEEMSDSGVVQALCAAAQRGVAVAIIMTDQGRYSRSFAQLSAAGAALALYDPSAPLYIHAKVLLADYGMAGARVFIGSENFSRASLDSNRELGLLFADPAVMASIHSTLSADFAGGQAYRGAGYATRAASMATARGNSRWLSR